MEKHWLEIGASLVLTLLLMCASSWGGSVQDEEILKKGTIEWGFMTGYGLSNSLGASRAGIDFFTLLPKVGYVFIELQGKPPLKGSLEVIAEAAPVLLAFESSPAFGSQTIYGGGLTALLRYDLRTGTRILPFVEGGAGLLVSTPQSRDPLSQFRASQFNFTLQIGAGLRYLLSKRVSLNLEYRFHHISDAHITEKNPGLNSDFVLLGLSLFQ